MADRIATGEQLNYSFLLLTHIVCADQQIHNDEVKALQEKAKHLQIGERTTEEMKKILAQEENQL
ncbi:hypothetical protein [Cylindrospermum sp. FACHB-282]|uniref:hypothetical protein n=1 Tax=Cylindrospermum sp. FACHB-282 TaxID=2692794 RepID=UPI001686355A|nr:hypothetical protein [Cylindrospermum sp. FACHB-282]MBD2384673.1 hypothetical protein [Cylindrospermum sp. FACHB-282]